MTGGMRCISGRSIADAMPPSGTLAGAAWLIVYTIFDRLLRIILHQGFITECFIELLFPD